MRLEPWTVDWPCGQLPSIGLWPCLHRSAHAVRCPLAPSPGQSAIVMRVELEEDPLAAAATEEFLGGLMIFCTAMTAVLAIPTTLLERVENPRDDSLKYVGRAEKIVRAGRKVAMMNIVYVDPEFQHATDLQDAYLRAEEEGGVEVEKEDEE